MRISLIGRGLRPWEHLTLAGLRALKQADAVFGIEPDQGAWQALTKEFAIPAIKPIDFLYQHETTEETNLRCFERFILEVAKQHEHVALVIAGHPRLGVNIARRLLESSLLEDLELEVIDGISSFDAMLNDLATDPLEKGTTVLDAHQLVSFRYALEPSLDTFIYNVSAVSESKTNQFECTGRSSLDLLVEHLRCFYPRSKKMTLCKAANLTGGASEYIHMTLHTLLDHALLIDPSTTLFIPGEKPASINSQFLTRMRSAHATAQNYSF